MYLWYLILITESQNQRGTVPGNETPKRYVKANASVADVLISLQSMRPLNELKY